MRNTSANCKNEVSVSLTITDFEEPSSEITRILGILPSKIWRKGELIDTRASICYKQNGWKIFSSLSKFQTLREHIDSLLEVLIPLSDRFKNLPPTCQIELSCCIYIYYEMPEISLDGHTIKTLSELDAGIDIDLYYLPADLQYLLSADDAEAVIDLGDELGLNPRDDRYGEKAKHWKEGPHIHIDGCNLDKSRDHIPALPR